MRMCGAHACRKKIPEPDRAMQPCVRRAKGQAGPVPSAREATRPRGTPREIAAAAPRVCRRSLFQESVANQTSTLQFRQVHPALSTTRLGCKHCGVLCVQPESMLAHKTRPLHTVCRASCSDIDTKGCTSHRIPRVKCQVSVLSERQGTPRIASWRGVSKKTTRIVTSSTNQQRTLLGLRWLVRGSQMRLLLPAMIEYGRPEVRRDNLIDCRCTRTNRCSIPSSAKPVLYFPVRWTAANAAFRWNSSSVKTVSTGSSNLCDRNCRVLRRQPPAAPATIVPH